MNTTTITVEKKVKRRLDQLKRHAREPYNDVLERLIDSGSHDDVDVDETMAILSDPETMERLTRSLKQLAKGQLIDFDDV